jgi:MYXO-CTERM domain-containing protein
MRGALLGLAFLVVPAASEAAGGQAVFEELQAGSPRCGEGHGLAYDSSRGRSVLFCLGVTWEWDGQVWVRSATTGPSARVVTAMTFDSARGKVVLFGGLTTPVGGSPLGDTWEWDGVSWVERTPAVAPSPRSSHDLAFDAHRGRVVLFGGSGAGLPNAETWEWDGTTWTARTPTAAPSARAGHAMAYDSTRERIVLFAGSSTHAVLRDTWEWDGAAWSLRANSGPTPRSGHAVAYDSGRRVLILVGGNTTSGGAVDHWEWDGATWSQVMPPLVPYGPEDPAMVYDALRARTVMTYGLTTGVRMELWEWDGQSWLQRYSASAPESRWIGALAWHAASGKLVLFGGTEMGWSNAYRDTWEWDGAAWAVHATPTSPAGRTGPCLVGATARGTVVLYGSAPASDDPRHWEWDGSSWHAITATMTPGDRQFHACAYDEARDTLVLFGGYDGSNALPPGTWEWNAGRWALRSPAHEPTPRFAHAMVYDAARRVSVMVGGAQSQFGGNQLSDETWTWDGNDWTLETPTQRPEARWFATLSYDTLRSRAILIGGLTDRQVDDVWEWDGTEWWPEAPAVAPPARQGAAAAFDPLRGRVVLYGGQIAAAAGDTWAYHVRGEDCASATSCDTGACVDQVCCEQAGCGVCEDCSSGAMPGLCAPVLGAPDPDSCSAACADGQGGASGHATRSACDGAGLCVSSTVTVCGLYRCAGTVCGTRCASSADCIEGAVCLFDSCVPASDGGVDGGVDAGPGGGGDAADGGSTPDGFGAGDAGSSDGGPGLPESGLEDALLPVDDVPLRAFDGTREDNGATGLPLARTGGCGCDVRSDGSDLAPSSLLLLLLLGFLGAMRRRARRVAVSSGMR